MFIYTSQSGELNPYVLNPSSGFKFDLHTNMVIYEDICANTLAYLVVDGVLTKDGIAVPINPPCSDCQVLDAVVGDAPATVEQLQAAVRLLILKPGFQRG